MFAHTTAVKDPVSTNPPLQKYRKQLLVVDDEPLLVKIIKRQLERRGYGITVSTDSKQALERIRCAPTQFDLLITDQSMPGLSGDELISAVKRINPQLPVILCSGHHNLFSDGMVAKLDLQACLAKPIEGNQLVNAVKLALKGK